MESTAASGNSWIEALQSGDECAATELWERYIDQLAAWSDRRLDAGRKRVMTLLNDDLLRRVASLRLAGFSNLEIADQIGQTDRSVKRKLECIRRIWAAAMEPDR